ncbi:MAG TPA: hypothetical protein VFY10_15165 [Dehalococcoidia bacterium]|nr:hypothetical protein [Dehalococcoidia bacterium]
MLDIFLIDGDSERRTLVAQHIEDMPGLRLTQAAPEIAAVRLVQEAQPNIVLVGVDDADSWLLPALRQALDGTPLLSYTNVWHPEIEWSAIQSGAKRLLGAADSRSTFLAAILEALRPAA